MDVSSRVADMLDIKGDGHRQGQGRICRRGAARRLRRRRTAREPAHRRQAGDARRLAGEPTMVADAEPQQPAPLAAARVPRRRRAPVATAAAARAVAAASQSQAAARRRRRRRVRSISATIARVVNTASAAPVRRRRAGRSCRPRRRADALFRRPRAAPALRLLRGDPFAQRDAAATRAEPRRADAAPSLICLRAGAKTARAIASARSRTRRASLASSSSSRRFALTLTLSGAARAAGLPERRPARAARRLRERRDAFEKNADEPMSRPRRWSS